LAQGVVESLDVVSVAGELGERVMLSSRNHSSIGSMVVGIEGCLLTLHRRNVRPQLLGAFTTAITDMKGNDLTRLPVHGDPDPVWISLLLYETPQLVRLNREAGNQYVRGGRNRLHMQMRRRRGKAGHHEVHQPAKTHSQSAAYAVQRNLLAQQVFHYQTLFFVYHALGGVDDKLPATVLAWVMLFAIMNVVILLEQW
jgi:hypothetical protein